MSLNVNASPILQAASTSAEGGAGIVGHGGDAYAVTNQDAYLVNDQFSNDYSYPILY